MDTELRRRFLCFLDRDFAALDLRAAGIKRWGSSQADWPVDGPRLWPKEREWWLRADPTPAEFVDAEPATLAAVA